MTAASQWRMCQYQSIWHGSMALMAWRRRQWRSGSGGINRKASAANNNSSINKRNEEAKKK